MLPPHTEEEEKAYTSQQAEISTAIRGKPRQPMVRNKTTPGRWPGPTGASVHPRQTKWRVSAIMDGTLGPKGLTVVIATSHHE
jgi:hypothetical protein